MTPTASAPEPARWPALPHVFVDRSLGAIQVPRLLRDAGISLTTMREHYGEQVGQRLEDPPWIALTAERGWLGFNKDDHIRQNILERRTVLETGARLFCIPNANLRADQVADRFLSNMARIERAAQEPGPYIYGVYVNEIRRFPLDS